MVMSLQEMSDRFEIQDLLIGYCYAVDNRDWDRLDDVFTSDAVIDYSEQVGVKGSLSEIKQFLKTSFEQVPAAQHAISTTQYQIDGDTARTRTVCYNPMTVVEEGTAHTVIFGLWYIHDYVRTEAGWRIKSLYEQHCYDIGMPDSLRARLPARKV